MVSAVRVVMILILLNCTSCQSETLLFESESGNTDPVSYASQIEPIFQVSCGGSFCHVGETTAGVDLTSYAATMTSMGTQYQSLIILAGNASESPILDKLTDSPRFGARMPLNKSRLLANEINLIQNWIDQGANNN